MGGLDDAILCVGMEDDRGKCYMIKIILADDTNGK